MKSINLFTLLFITTLLSQPVHAEEGLTIHAAEIGIGKFHRKDNSVHPYADDNAWKPYVLANGADTKTPLTVANQNGSFTIFFSNLDELLSAVEALSVSQKMKVKNFNMNAHGLPGHMWFPQDAKTQASFKCARWRQSAAAPDEANYKQYYSPVPKNEIMQIRELSHHSSVEMPCVTGLYEWQQIATRHHLKSLFTSDAQIHFMSCVVGLGLMGDEFTKGIAALIAPGEQVRVQSSMMFGLGDWSMSEGMGFWDYQNDAQLNRDNTNYPKNRSDREQMQKGSIRTAGLLNGRIASGIMTGRDFMFADGRDPGTLSASFREATPERTSALPASIRIPGTNQKVSANFKR